MSGLPLVGCVCVRMSFSDLLLVLGFCSGLMGALQRTATPHQKEALPVTPLIQTHYHVCPVVQSSILCDLLLCVDWAGLNKCPLIPFAILQFPSFPVPLFCIYFIVVILCYLFLEYLLFLLIIFLLFNIVDVDSFFS